MNKVFKKGGKYLKYDEYTTHTGARRTTEWVDDLQMATVFSPILPLHLRNGGELQGADALEAVETRTVTLTANVEFSAAPRMENEMEDCCEVSIVEKLRSIPEDYRTCVAIQWAEDGTETGHRFIPVGYMMHEAADEIERLQTLAPNAEITGGMTYEPPIRDRLHSYGGNTFMSHDCQIAARRLDEAVTLCDRAQDYLSIKLAHDPLAAKLAAEMRDFIGRVDHVCVPDDEPPNVKLTGCANSEGVTKK